jgi:hypothetical protein
MADPRRMTPEEQGEAHTLLVEAVSDPDWQAARQALDELMRKLLVVHRLLEAEERLAPARAASRADVTAAGAQALNSVTGPRVRAVSRSAPGGSRPLSLVGGRARDLVNRCNRVAVRARSYRGGSRVRRGRPPGPPVWLCGVVEPGTASERCNASE